MENTLRLIQPAPAILITVHLLLQLTLLTNAEDVAEGQTTQLNCTSNLDICLTVCSESKGELPFSSTFCEPKSGSCVCDCRDALKKSCNEEPFTKCFQGCVNMNPNPDVFLYEGGNCPIVDKQGVTSYQCACGCSFRDDYEETNDI